MALLTRDVQMTEEEYIQFELNSEIRHEYVNGKLIDMPGKSVYNNKIALILVFIFMRHLKEPGFHCYMEGVKLKLSEGKYFYPDVFVTKEAEAEGNKFIRYNPEIIVEVLSQLTRKYDAVDKFINYQKFQSLKYYLLVEPEFPLVTLFYKAEEGEWEMESFTDKNASVPLPLFNFSIALKEVYS